MTWNFALPPHSPDPIPIGNCMCLIGFVSPGWHPALICLTCISRSARASLNQDCLDCTVSRPVSVLSSSCCRRPLTPPPISCAHKCAMNLTLLFEPVLQVMVVLPSSSSTEASLYISCAPRSVDLKTVPYSPLDPQPRALTWCAMRHASESWMSPSYTGSTGTSNHEYRYSLRDT